MFALFWCLHLSLFAQRQRIDSLLGAWSKGLHDTMDMRVSYQLGKDYLHISGDSSMWFANRALRLTIKYKDEDRQANCYAILGANEKNRGNYERALDYHLKAMRIKENEDDTPSLAITLNDIGVVYKIMGRLDQALGYYRKSNLLCVAIGLGKGIAMTYNNIGTIFREKRMLDSALYYYELGLRQAEKNG